MTPWSCAVSTRDRRAIAKASESGIGPRERRSASVGPSINSRTSACVAPVFSNPLMYRCSVVERREDLRFAPESGEPIGIRGEGLGKIFSATLSPSLSRGRGTPLPCLRRRGRRTS